MQSLSNSLVGIINQTLIPKKSGEGYALAVDFMANHKRQYSKFMGDSSKIQMMLERNEDGTSLSLADSVVKLITDSVVDKSDVVKVLSGNAAVYDKIRTL